METSQSSSADQSEPEENLSNNDINLFKEAISHRSNGSRSMIHRFNSSVYEWVLGRFNISVCDLLIDAAHAMNKSDYEKAKQWVDSADQIMKIWKKDQFPLGGFMSAKPTEVIKTPHGTIILSKLVKAVNLCVKTTNKLFELDKEASQIEEHKGKALSALKDAINIVAPGDSRKSEKSELFD